MPADVNPVKADTIFINANIVTMDDAESRFRALAVRNGRIIALGMGGNDSDDESILSLATAATEIIDVKGKTLLPGFIDSHVHFTQTGLGAVGYSVYDQTGKSAVLAVVAGAVAETPPGQPILVHGLAIGDLDAEIGKADLDAISTEHPIMIGDVGAHACVLNSKALALLQPDLDSAATTGDKGIGSTGVLTGPANTRARYRFYNYAVSDSQRIAALQRASQMALETGITTVHALEGGNPSDGRGWLPERDVEILLQVGDQLPIHVVVYCQSTDVERVASLGLPRIGGCIWVDGAYDEFTAALLEPYCNCQHSKGSLYFSDQELNAFVLKAHRAGMQISMHAIGDAAIEQLLNAYENALREYPREDHRHRIEHFSLPTTQHIERAARLGVAVGMQPNFALMPQAPADTPEQGGGGLVDYLGEERYRRRHPYRSIVDSGVLVAGGSDADPKPMGPLIGIHALVNHPDEQRRLSVYEALKLYTSNGAKIAFEEQNKGTLSVGKLADLIILDEDPFTVQPSQIMNIPVSAVFVEGRRVYDA